MAATDYTNKMILQPSTQNISLDSTSNPASFVEVWKGPWADIRDVFKTQKVKGFTLIVGIKRPNFESDANWIAEYAAPMVADATKYPWIISAIDVKETVGDLGFLTLTYQAGTPEYDAGEDGKSDPEKVDVDPDTSETTTWNITWGEYNRSMLDYSTIPEKQIKMKEFPTSEPWYYFDDATEEQRTFFPENEKERKIQAYYAKNVAPRFHYPIITRRWELQVAADQAKAPMIGEDIDKPVAKPISFPFKLDAKWKFIQVSDNAAWSLNKRQTVVVKDEETGQTETKEVSIYTFVRETAWQGAEIWDENFYGPNAWKPVNPNDIQDGQ